MKWTIKKLLASAYGVVFVTLFVLYGVLGVILIRDHTRAEVATYVKRVDSILKLNKNEILNEVALFDADSLYRHVEILRQEFQCNAVSIQAGGGKFASRAPEGRYREERAAEVWIRKVVEKVSGLNRSILTRSLSNEFGSLSVEVTVDYTDVVMDQMVVPAVAQFLISFGICIVIETLLFWMIYVLLQRFLIVPLTSVGEQLRNDSRNAESAPQLPCCDEQLKAGKLVEVADLIDSLVHYQQLRRRVNIADLASQVAHDIRSPLAAISAAESELFRLPEETRLLLRGAIGRIRDIANHLMEMTLDGRRSQQSQLPIKASLTQLKTTKRLVCQLIDPLVTEKRTQYRSKIGILIDFSQDEQSYGVFAKVDPAEFQRVLSNLIDNAVEAIEEQGKVTLSLGAIGDFIEIRCSDTGRGIPPEVLQKLGLAGGTFGKQNGTGLGLYHARTTLEKWGGRLEIESRVGRGTTVTVVLPRAVKPGWFLPQIEVRPGAEIVVLDDDPSIHKIWEGRFEKLKPAGNSFVMKHFSTEVELVASRAEAKQNVLYLVDFELLGLCEKGERASGLDLIERLGIAENAILVTSHFEELVDRCTKLGLKIIPKSMAAFVPIVFQSEADAGAVKVTANSELDGAPVPISAVLIDNDSLVRRNWMRAAKTAGVPLKTYRDCESFYQDVSFLNRDATVYIDSDLGGEVPGQVEAQAIARLGFSKIILATGFADVGQLPRHLQPRGGNETPNAWTEVCGKEPPWAVTHARERADA